MGNAENMGSSDASKSASMRAAINQQLTESGEKEHLKQMIRERLREHGWADNLKQYTKELVASKGEQITVDELVSEITPRARSTVPDEVKKELLTRIRGFLAQQGQNQ